MTVNRVNVMSDLKKLEERLVWGIDEVIDE